MSRSTRTLLVLALSLAVAGGASFLVLRQVQNIPVREVEVSNYQVAVAARALPMGSQLAATDVKLIAWPQSSPVAGAYSRVEDVVNRGLVAAVQENEPLTATKLATLEAGAGLPPIITPGMRAISLKVDEVIGVAGFVVPGAKVDVVMTLNQQTDGGMSRVVVSNIQVLAAGTKIDQEQARDGRPLPATVVTVLVTPEDAERISLAASVGRVTLTLRNPLDIEPTQTPGVRVASLTGATPAAPATPRVTPRPRPTAERPVAAAPAPVPQIYTVETIRAAKRTAEVVR